MGVKQIPLQGRAATLLCSVAARSCAGRPGRPTNLVREGHDIVLVAELMGHARLETTRRYTKPSETDRQTPSTPSPPTDSAAGYGRFPAYLGPIPTTVAFMGRGRVVGNGAVGRSVDVFRRQRDRRRTRGEGLGDVDGCPTERVPHPRMDKKVRLP